MIYYKRSQMTSKVYKEKGRTAILPFSLFWILAKCIN